MHCFYMSKLKQPQLRKQEDLEAYKGKLYWETIINYQNPNLKLKLNGTNIEDLLDTGVLCQVLLLVDSSFREIS